MRRPVAPSPCTDADVVARLVGVRRVLGRGAQTVVALDDVSLDVPARAMTAIVGPSGAGKSTLLLCLTGLLLPDSGIVVVAGVDVAAASDTERTRLRRDHIGIVRQRANLHPAWDVADNIRLPLLLARRTVDPAWFDVVVDGLGLRSRLHHRPTELSGGEEQRVALARALIVQPDLVVCDEPTGSLDRATADDVLALVVDLAHRWGRAVVVATHDDRVAAASDHVVHLLDGRIVPAGTAAVTTRAGPHPRAPEGP
jgi:putative ABC transport system ATP-binding protein